MTLAYCTQCQGYRLGARKSYMPLGMMWRAGRDSEKILLVQQSGQPRRAAHPPEGGRSRSIERIVNPPLRAPVYCVQYAISGAPHCVQDRLRALIDRKNSFRRVCFPGFRTPDRRRCLPRKLACRGNRLAMRHLRASRRNIAFNSLTSKIELLCQLVLKGSFVPYRLVRPAEAFT